MGPWRHRGGPGGPPEERPGRCPEAGRLLGGGGADDDDDAGRAPSAEEDYASDEAEDPNDEREALAPWGRAAPAGAAQAPAARLLQRAGVLGAALALAGCAWWGPRARRAAGGAASPAEAVEVVGLAVDECEDAAEGSPCYASVAWVMQTGIYEHPEWFEGLDKEARFEEVQAKLAEDDPSKEEDQKSHCKAPCRDPSAVKRHRGIPGSALDLPVPGPYAERQELEFYMYRAQSDHDYPMENVDTADLAGVMWYLHNEIVVAVGRTRKYGVTRIRRFKVKMRTTWAYYNSHRRQFGSFVAFDSGHCTVPDCDRIWMRFGALPGCQHVDTQRERAAYMSDVKTYIGDDCEGYQCRPPVWYSLPGSCPNHNNEEKTPECIRDLPGGLCDAATGDRDCTYSVEDAGEIGLDVVTGIDDYVKFFKDGGIEYSERRDAGVNCDFWNGKHDENKCKERVDKVKRLFDEAYPEMPKCDDLPGPPCDTDGYYEGELEASLDDWPVHEDGPLEVGTFGAKALDTGGVATKSAPANEASGGARPDNGKRGEAKAEEHGAEHAGESTPHGAEDSETKPTSSTSTRPTGTASRAGSAATTAAAATTTAATPTAATSTARSAAARDRDRTEASTGAGAGLRPLDVVRSSAREGGAPPPDTTFSVTLDHSNTEVLGLAFTMVDEAIVVDAVTGGLFEKWNREHPDKQVLRGDLVVAVNGVRGSSLDLAEQLREPRELRVELQSLEPRGGGAGAEEERARRTPRSGAARAAAAWPALWLCAAAAAARAGPAGGGGAAAAGGPREAAAAGQPGCARRAACWLGGRGEAGPRLL